jgi:hypothetical protein
LRCHGEHAVDSPGEIHGGRTRATNALVRRCEPALIGRRIASRFVEREHHPHRSRDSNRRRAAHRKRRDRVANFVDGAKLAVLLPLGQPTLIENPHGTAVIGPADGFYGGHLRKLLVRAKRGMT